jgi:catechol-2,3-dioxygenase
MHDIVNAAADAVALVTAVPSQRGYAGHPGQLGRRPAGTVTILESEPGVPVASGAPCDSRPEAWMAVRRLNHAVLYVNGLDRAVDFYTTVLGLEVIAAMPGQAAFLLSPGSLNEHDLGLFEIGRGRNDGQPRVGLYHLAWEVATLADLVDTRDKLVRAAALVGESDHGLTKSLYAKDPSGNELEVMWAVPVADREAELARATAPTMPLDWERTLARWDPQLKTGSAATA